MHSDLLAQVSASPMAIEPVGSLSASAMPLISPSALLQAHLARETPLRPSSRLLTQTRPIHLNTGSLTHCNGSALVRLGESTIVCGIRAELLLVTEIAHYRASETSRQQTATSSGDNSYEAVTLNNLLVPNLELNTNIHPSFPANTAPSTIAQSISQRVLSLLHSSHLVKTQNLEVRHTSSQPAADLDPDDPAYVEPERDALKAYWVLYIDCVALGYGGESNCFDATVLAVIAALRNVRLPQARWDEDDKRILCDASHENTRRLTLNGLPCPLSFGVFVPDPRLKLGQENAKLQVATLLDTDAFEDGVCEERGSVVVDCSGGDCKILRLEKNGGAGALSAKGVKEIVQLATKRWQEWKGVLEAAEANG